MGPHNLPPVNLGSLKCLAYSGSSFASCTWCPGANDQAEGPRALQRARTVPRVPLPPKRQCRQNRKPGGLRTASRRSHRPRVDPLGEIDKQAPVGRQVAASLVDAAAEPLPHFEGVGIGRSLSDLHPSGRTANGRPQRQVRRAPESRQAGRQPVRMGSSPALCVDSSTTFDSGPAWSKGSRWAQIGSRLKDGGRCRI